MKITFQSPPKYLDEKMLYNILRDYKILNCDVLIRDENATVDDFIDTIMAPHRKYIKCLYAYNKIDAISLQHLRDLAREPHTVVMSCELDLGIQVWFPYRSSLLNFVRHTAYIPRTLWSDAGPSCGSCVYTRSARAWTLTSARP